MLRTILPAFVAVALPFAAQADEARPFPRIVVTGTDEARTWDVARALARESGALRALPAEVFGPAPAPIARVRGRYRVRLLVKAAKGVPLQAALGYFITKHIAVGVEFTYRWSWHGNVIARYRPSADLEVFTERGEHNLVRFGEQWTLGAVGRVRF